MSRFAEHQRHEGNHQKDTRNAPTFRLSARPNLLCHKIPFESLHVLVLDRMGKDISGAGMDTNVLGRWRIHGVAETATPQIACIVPLSLTAASHGNAAGLGLAEFVPLRLAESVDLVAERPRRGGDFGQLAPAREVADGPIVQARPSRALPLGR